MDQKYQEIFSLLDEPSGKAEKISLTNLNVSLSSLLQVQTLIQYGFDATTYLGLYYADYIHFSPVTRTGLLNYINYLKSSEFSENDHLDYLESQLELNKQQAIQVRSLNYE